TLAEVDLGDELVHAVRRMADRCAIDDLAYWSQALQVQRVTGGPIAPLTRNVVDTMTERAALRQEVRSLTAESRLSAYLLGGLPAALLVVIEATNPTYMDPLYK